MNAQREEIKEASRWVRVAEDDLRSAEYLLTMGDTGPFNVICFLAQQSAEKYLKSLLIYLAVDFAKTHDLIALINSVPPSAGLTVSPQKLVGVESLQHSTPLSWRLVALLESRRRRGGRYGENRSRSSSGLPPVSSIVR